MASPLAEQEGAPRHVGPDRDTGQRLGCGPSEADLCDRKGKPAFASETGPTDFTQFSPPLKAELSAPCHPIVLWHIVLPFLSGSLPLGFARLTKADGQQSAQHRREEPFSPDPNRRRKTHRRHFVARSIEKDGLRRSSPNVRCVALCVYEPSGCALRRIRLGAMAIDHAPVRSLKVAKNVSHSEQ